MHFLIRFLIERDYAIERVPSARRNRIREALRIFLFSSNSLLDGVDVIFHLCNTSGTGSLSQKLDCYWQCYELFKCFECKLFRVTEGGYYLKMDNGTKFG